MPDNNEPKTDPYLKVVKLQDNPPPVEQLKQDDTEKTQQIGPDPVTEDYVHVSGFNKSLYHLVKHADKHAQKEGEYQSRWQDWKTKLEALYREVNSHV